MRAFYLSWIGIFFLASLGARAGGLQDQLNARWRGAWVILKIESYSNCDAIHTNNRINGRLVTSKGRESFPVGELAKVKKVDLKRSRIDVLLEVVEPRLVAYQDGPFRLFEERHCLQELLVEVPRAEVKSRDIGALEAAMSEVMERHATREEATSSSSWNHRKRRPYPEDYQQTLIEYKHWKAEQRLIAIRQRRNESLEKASTILRAVSPNAEYADGFTFGIDTMRNAYFGDCDALMSGSFSGYEKAAPKGNDSREWKEGYRDGQQLVYYLELARHLEPCLEEVP